MVEKNKPTQEKQPKALVVEEELKNTPAPEGQDPVALAFYIKRLNTARDERAQRRKEFDGMTFERDYERNRETAFSMLRPKLNESDVRVNSGTAEKKIELTMNELLAMNFQPELRSFDKDDRERKDIAVEFTDIVRSTNYKEKDEDTYGELIQDLLTQRVAIAEERMESRPFYGKKYSRKCAVKRRISPLSVYFGDMFIPLTRLHEQPYIVIYERMLYDRAKAELGHLDAFKHVRPGVGLHDEYVWANYRFGRIEENEVEVITILDAANNEKQIISNSIMMYEPGKNPMPCKTGYPLFAATVKTIPDFVYGKPPIASAKFLQGLSDETIVNLIRKFRQALEPPIGVPSGKVYSRDIWTPGAMTQGLNSNNFSRLIDHQGVTTSEFQMYNLVNQEVEKFIGAQSISNQPGSGKMTATQVIEMQKEGIKMLGSSVLAVSRLKRDATFIRLDTIFREYFKPEGKRGDGDSVKDKYRTFELNDGRNRFQETVQKYIVLTDRNLSKSELQSVKNKEENEYSSAGKPVRYSFMNVKALLEIPLDFHVVITPEQRDSGAFEKLLFQDQLAQASQISQVTGRKLNGDKVIEDFERTWKSRGLFESATGEIDAKDPKSGSQKLLQDIQNMAQSDQPIDQDGNEAPIEGSDVGTAMKAAPKQMLQV